MKTKSLALAALFAPTLAVAQNVTIENFVRAESDHMFRSNMEMLDIGLGEMTHLREPTTPEQQPVIRMNQDTLYSATILDLTEPVEITLPDTAGRYLSMHVINQDHYMFVETQPGTYSLTQDEIGTRFAMVAFRTFADVNDPDDIAKAHIAQDGIKMTGGGAGPFDAPKWELEQLELIRGALNTIAVLGFDTSYAFGREGETRPVDHLVGSAVGWGGLPREAAMYMIESVAANDGETPHAVTVGDVPVNAFWSVTVYNSDGYLEANDLGINSFNDITADRNDDGTITLHFGECEDGRVNCIPITPGWNYAIRLYEPQKPLLDGNWTFPEIEPVN